MKSKELCDIQTEIMWYKSINDRIKIQNKANEAFTFSSNIVKLMQRQRQVKKNEMKNERARELYIGIEIDYSLTKSIQYL